MKEFFDSIERHWARIASNSVETPEGPKTIYPSELVLWSEIYSPAEMKRLNGLFDQAEKLAAKDPLFLARIKFVRREFMEPLTAEAEKFNRANDAVRAWRFVIPEFKGRGAPSEKEWAAAPAFHLSGLGGKVAEVASAAKVMYDAENFYFRFECAEKETRKIRAFLRPFDRKAVWEDSDVELFISPDGDRQHYYQLLINARGSWADLEVTRGATDFRWNSSAKVSAKIIPEKGWQAEVILPRRSMRKAAPDGILADFTRHRVMEDVKVGTPYYCWSPFARHFGDVSRFGKLLFAPDAEKNLFANPDFDPAKIKKNWYGSFSCDKAYFLTGGCSAKLECGGKAEVEVRQYLGRLKPDTDYEAAFFVRLDNVKKLKTKASGFYVKVQHGNAGHDPFYYPSSTVEMTGSSPWTGLSFRFRTPKDFNIRKNACFRFILYRATGKVWIDHVKLVELPGKASATERKCK